jgi:hypothetical protein
MKEQNAKEELHLLLTHKHELTQRNSMSYDLESRIKELRKFLDSLNDDDKKQDVEIKDTNEMPF